MAQIFARGTFDKRIAQTWEANCRGLDEHGTPLVAVHGSEQLDAVERARLVSAAPRLLEALQNLVGGLQLAYNRHELWQVESELRAAEDVLGGNYIPLDRD